MSISLRDLKLLALIADTAKAKFERDSFNARLIKTQRRWSRRHKLRRPWSGLRWLPEPEELRLVRHWPHLNRWSWIAAFSFNPTVNSQQPRKVFFFELETYRSTRAFYCGVINLAGAQIMWMRNTDTLGPSEQYHDDFARYVDLGKITTS